ncbi:uncharacterized protein LOC123710995 [Pieris brassicae]|uniref:MD-2-related lipid-recognition domain-containing protein n=1 Tax=Pieris brassicae TaxID=7116 RepID=A0A9P0XEN7_PIEBR|nr:uncharacterized protein LOC123710995 [Pieris brassicae]XP_045519336.1 uncharacterized protein LOC123710995 [Pieris brassicae]CAH4035610.1 unnamed protein product [Pieris brassicae]
MFQLFVIACVFILVYGEPSTNVNRCNQNEGELPLHIYIQDCIDPPCRVVTGADVVVNVIFKVPRTTRSMATKAIVFSSREYDLEEYAITCNFLRNTYCPVFRDEVVEYTLRMHVESWFPAIPSIPIMFRVIDEKQAPIWCISTTIEVIKPSKTVNNETLIE